MAESTDPQELVDLLRSDDVKKRVHAFKHLKIVVKSLGPEATRTQLLPCLEELVDDDPRPLTVLAEQLGTTMLDGIGGGKHGPLLLTSLEALIQSDESNVRQAAAKSILRVADSLSSKDKTEHLMPLCDRLIEKKSFFNSKAAACYIIPGLYKLMDENEQLKLRTIFLTELCVEPSPVVRRAACVQIGKLAGVLDVKYIKTELLKAMDVFCQDEQTSVRLLIPKACVAIVAAVRDCLLIETQVLDMVVKLLAKDESWRVRHTCVSVIAQLVEVVQKPPGALSALLDCYFQLGHDSEAEVRHAAASQLASLGKCLHKLKETLHVDIQEDKMISIVQDFKADQSTYVRAAFANAVPSLASVFVERHVDEFGVVICALLQDQESEVRLAAIGALDQTFHKVIGVDRVSDTLLASIRELAANSDWRKREAVISYMPMVCQQLGADFFQQNLASMCMDCLGDSVYSVRQAVTRNLAKLASMFGSEWAREHLIPECISLSVHRSYIYRMIALTGAADMAPEVGIALATSHLLGLVMRLSDDTVSNVRIHVARTLGILIPFVEEAAVHALIGPKLLHLAKDPDKDVRYYACVSIEEMGQEPNDANDADPNDANDVGQQLSDGDSA